MDPQIPGVFNSPPPFSELSNSSAFTPTRENLEKVAHLQKTMLPQEAIWTEQAERLFNAMTDQQVQKVVVNALLDSCLDGGYWQGSHLEDTSQVYLRLLQLYWEAYPEASQNRQWKKIEGYLKQVYAHSKWEFLDLDSLQPNQSLTFPLNWAHHSVIIRVERADNDLLHLYLYNSGLGVETFHSHRRENGNLRINPVCTYKNIPQEKFLRRYKENPGWVDILYALKMLPKKYAESHYIFSAEDLYLRVLGPFLSYRIPDLPFSEIPTLLSQRGGTCSWDVLDALTAVEHQDSTLSAYRHFKAFANYTLVTGFYARFRNTMSSLFGEDQKKKILQISAQKLAKSSSKRLVEGRLTHGEAAKRFASVQHILNTVEKWDAEALFSLRKQKLWLWFSNKHLPLQQHLQDQLTRLSPYAKGCDHPSITPPAIPEILFRPPSFNHIYKWTNKLAEAFVEYVRQGRSATAHTLLELAAVYLPLPGPETQQGLQQLKKYILQKIADCLSSLLLFYARSYERGVAENGFKELTAYRLLALVRQIVVIIDDALNGSREGHPRIGDYQLYRWRDHFHSNLLTLSPQPEQAAAFEVLDAYFTALPLDKKGYLCAFSRLMTINDQTDSDDAHYYRRLLKVRPELREALKSHLTTKDRLDLKYVDVSEESHFVAELLTDMGKPTGIADHWQCNLLGMHGLSHLVSLKRAALACHFLEGATEAHSSAKGTAGEIKFTTYAWLNSDDKKISIVLGLNQERTWKSSTFQKHRGEERFLGKLLRDSRVREFIDKIYQPYQQKYFSQNENELLRLLAHSDKEIPAGRALVQAMAQGRLRPHFLLRHFAGELRSRLHEPFVQFLYEWCMYRGWSNECRKAPLYEAVGNRYFLRLFKRWITSIFKNYTHLQKSCTKELDTFLFAMRHLQRVTVSLRGKKPPFPLIFELDYYTLWLQNPGLSVGKRTLIHLYRAGAIAAHGIDCHDVETLAKLLESWIFFKQTPSDPKYVPIEIIECVQLFLCSPEGSKILQRLDNPVDGAFIFERISKQLQLSFFSNSCWTRNRRIDPFLYCYEERWGIHLLTGDLYTPEGLATVASWTSHSEHTQFQRIFNKRNNRFKHIGPYVYFSDALYGECRARLDKEKIQIEKKFEGCWALCIFWNNDLFKGLPLSLLADHSHWLIDQPESRWIEICALKSGKRRYTIEVNGEIKTADKRKTFVFSKHDSFSHFESPSFIERWIDSDSGRNSLVFRRLQLLNTDGERLGSGRPLELERYQNGFILTANRAYKVPEEQPCGMVGAIKNYLYLTAENKSPLLLLPMRPIFFPKEFSKEVYLQISDELENGEYPQRLTRFVLPFDIKKGMLLPKNELGKLYLAYLCLGQRNYERAIELLTSFDRQEPDESQQQVLLWIILQGNASHDHHPNAAAVRIFAHRIFLRCKTTELISGDEWEVLHKTVKQNERKYRMAKNHVSEGCLLENLIHPGDSLWTTWQRGCIGDREQIIVGFGNCEVPPFPGLCLYDVFWQPSTQDSEKGAEWKIRKDLQQLTREGISPILPSLTLAEILSRYPADWLPKHFLQLYNWALSDSAEKRYRLYCYLWMIGGALQINQLPAKHPCLRLYQALLSAYQNPNEFKKISFPFVEKKTETQKQWRALHRFFIDIFAKIPPVTQTNPVRFTEKNTGIPQKSSLYPRRTHPVAGKEGEKFLTEKKNLIGTLKENRLAIFERAYLEKQSALTPPKKELEGLNEHEKSIIQELYLTANKGREKWQQKVSYLLKKGTNLRSELDALKETIETKKQSCQASLQMIEAMVSPHNNEPHIHLPEQLSATAGGIAPVKFATLLRLFLANNTDGYSKANRHLDAKGRLFLDNLLLQHLVERTELQHLQRMLPLFKILIENLPETETFVSALQELGSLVETPRGYDPCKSRAQLVFEALDNKRIRPEQAALLKYIEDDPLRNGIFSLTMGGGKTSVIACIWGHLVASKKRLACLVVPEAQLLTVYKNLRRIQMKAFGQEIVVIHAKAGELDEEKLNAISNEVEFATEGGHLLLFSPETLQHIELRALSLCDQLSRFSEPALVPMAVLFQIGRLQKLASLFRSEPAAFVDEAALLLSTKKEVRVPVGKWRQMKMAHIELVRQCFEILSDSDLEPIVRLRENNQNEMPSGLWRDQVASMVAKKLSEYPPFGLQNNEQKHSFQRYLLYDIPPAIEAAVRSAGTSAVLKEPSEQDVRDLAFLKGIVQLNECGKGSIPELIALARLLLQIIIPSVLKHRVGRDFGDARDGIPGRICHYSAKETPEGTDFGLDIEGAAKYFMNVLAQGVNEKEIRFIAHEMDRSARHFVRTAGENYSDTAEAREFQKVTSISLDQSSDPAQLKKAKRYLEHHPTKLLDFQSLIIIHRVQCYTECLTNSAAHFVEQVKVLFGGSGNPWNYRTFGKGLAKGYIPDTLHEGRLLYLLLSRGELEEAKVHALETFAPQRIAALIAKQNYSFLVDCGGRLDNIEELNHTVLATIDRFTAILFYRRSKGERGANRLSLLRRGDKEPFFIGGSRKEDIAAFVDPEKVFYLFDQAHSIGTDFPIPKKARGLIIVDATSTLEEIEQAAGRAREMQPVDFAIARQNSERFFQLGKTPRHLLIQGAFNSCEQLREEAKRSYSRRVVNAVQQLPLKCIFAKHDPHIPDVSIGGKAVAEYRHFRKVLLMKQCDDIWRRYGLFQGEEPFSETLKKLAQETLERLPTEKFDECELQILYREIEDILHEAENSSLFANQSEKEEIPELGTEQAISQEIAIDQEVGQETKLSHELLQELRDCEPCQLVIRAQRLFFQPAKSLCEYYKKAYIDILPVKEIFKKVTYKAEYAELFSAHFHLTKNAAKPFQKWISVFSIHFGECEAVLVYPAENDTFDFLGVSKSDAERFHQHSFQKDDPWLIDAEGRLLAAHPLVFPYTPGRKKASSPQAEEIHSFLCELNLFNGNAFYLVGHEKKLLQKWSSDGSMELRRRYLRLQVEKDDLQKRCFYESPLFSCTQEGEFKGRIHRLRYRKMQGK